MTEKQDKQLEAIGKIISLTRNDSIKWTATNAGSVPRKTNDDIIESVYLTEYKGKILRIYLRRFRGVKVMKTLGMLMGAPTSPEDLRWYSEIILDIANESNESLWEFPKEEVLNDLLKLIKFKTSGAEDLINNLLNE